jgi:hypothetical protein
MKRETQAAMITALGGITQVGSRLSKAIDVAGFGDVAPAAEVVAGAARSLRGIADSLDGISSALARNDDESDDDDEATPPAN